jgi:hypothetical protein
MRCVKTSFKQLTQVSKTFRFFQLISANLKNSHDLTPLNQRVEGSSPSAPTKQAP